MVVEKSGENEEPEEPEEAPENKTKNEKAQIVRASAGSNQS